MKKYLTYQDDKSNKFWNIEVAGKSFTVTYGKTGATGQNQTKTFNSEAKCLKEAEKLVNEKLKKGYIKSEKGSDAGTKNEKNDLLIKDISKIEVEVKSEELFNAIKERSLKKVKRLIEKGADVNVVMDNGEKGIHRDFKTPLYYALRCSELTIAKLLIKSGANVNAQNQIGDTPLHQAYDLGIVKMLLERGVDVNVQTEDGNAPLHYANIEKARILIKHGADVNARNDDGETPLCEINSLEHAKLLLDNGAKINVPGNQSPLKHLCSFLNIDKDNIDLAKYLLEKGADPNWGDDTFTPLHHIAISNGSIKMAKLLVDKGANVNAVRKDTGSTPLHYAAERYLELVDFLIKHGANVNVKDMNGKTPLYYAKLKKIQKILKDNKGKGSLTAKHLKFCELNVTKLEKTYKIKLPKEYTEFIASKKCIKYNGNFADLPSYADDSAIVYFSLANKSGQPEVVSLFDQGDEFNENIDAFIPFASIYVGNGIDHKEPQFLVINATKGNTCPVLMYEHETGEFEPVAKSINAFIKLLKKPE